MKKMCHFRNNPFAAPKGSSLRSGFTFVEVIVAVTILAVILTSVLTVMDRCLEVMIDSKSEMQAFELARENMEELLSSASVKETTEYGIYEENPDIAWQTSVETFYEPITARMWVQGVCTAEYTNSKGKVQTIELTHWLTNVSKQQVIQILDQQQRERDYQQQLYDDDISDTTGLLDDGFPNPLNGTGNPPGPQPDKDEDYLFGYSRKEIEQMSIQEILAILLKNK